LVSSDIYSIGYYQRRERTVIKVISDFIQIQISNKHVVNSTNLLNVKEIEKFEDLGLDVWITLKWIFRKYMRPRIAYMRISYGGSLLTTTNGLSVP
jgi:hypothetical protein